MILEHKAEWWEAVAELQGLDVETRARCVGNAVYEAARSRNWADAKELGLKAYHKAGGTTFKKLVDVS